MNFFKGFGNGFLSFFKAFSFVFGKGLWYYLLLSFALWLLMLIGIHTLIEWLADIIKEWVQEQVKLDSIPDKGHWLSWAKGFVNGYLGILVSWIIRILLWFCTGTFTKYLTLILLSPILSLLSESVEKKLTGKDYPFNFVQLMKDILRGSLISIRNLILELFFIFMLWLFTLVFPPLVFITTPLMIIIGWYFAGFSMMDYSCERQKMGVIKSVRFIRKNKGIAIGIGFCYSIFMWIPLLGLVFAPIMAVTGATLVFHDLKAAEANVPKKI